MCSVSLCLLSNKQMTIILAVGFDAVYQCPQLCSVAMSLHQCCLPVRVLCVNVNIIIIFINKCD